MNVFYWGDGEMADTEYGPELEVEEDLQLVDSGWPDLGLQQVSEPGAERDADDEAFISAWLAERQCSGL